MKTASSGRAYVYIDKELQRVSREALGQTEEHGVKLKFPSILACRHTVLVLKEPKTKTSVRKVFLPRAVAEMLVERKKDIEELKELLGDEYTDYNLVFASSSGTPTEGSTTATFSFVEPRIQKSAGTPHSTYFCPTSHLPQPGGPGGIHPGTAHTNGSRDNPLPLS